MKLNDIDLSKYRLAYFFGVSADFEDLSMDQANVLIEKGALTDTDIPRLYVALIPKKRKLTECSGDDWNDCPAAHNASGFYQYPKGTIFLKGLLGGEMRVEKD